MAFFDIRKISYGRMKAITESEKPYRGSPNAYPMGDRRYSDRHFRKEDNGTFSVWYADRGRIDNIVSGGDVPHASAWIASRKLVVIHPDNSVEFMRDSYDQGDNMYLTEALGWRSHNVKAMGGGVITKFGTQKVQHPLFVGLRVDLETGNVLTPYTLERRVLNKQRAKQLMEGYEDFLQTYRPMVSAMNGAGFYEVMTDLFKELGEKKMQYANRDDVIKLINERRYVDAAVLFSFIFSGSYWRYSFLARQGIGMPNDYGLDNLLSEMNSLIDKKFKAEIYMGNPSVFDTEETSTLQACKWGVLIKVNGAVVKSTVK